MSRGQFSIDFFLVLSIVVAFSVLLYNVALGEIGKTKLLDSAVLGKHALDELASGVDTAAFSGNQSRLRKELFVPEDVNCLYFNSTENAFYCFVTSSFLEGRPNRLVSRSLLSSTPLDVQCGLAPGWHAASFFNNGSHVVVSCSGV
ncbi:hypothetical protein HY572_03945 [Candidatus Micrarchaeota archaeon]|nr:hypothetical protein [Candidatus Micrarchaeota archaeon]